MSSKRIIRWLWISEINIKSQHSVHKAHKAIDKIAQCRVLA
ncbi:hypothetical protein N879_13945 [Alcaligenes sp. EGD-AK7]|nr:hypothetical protein N879_13945 [Alcaligenes sp. EGD-AK7]